MCEKVGEELGKVAKGGGDEKEEEDNDDGGLWKLLLSLLVKIPGLAFTVGI